MRPSEHVGLCKYVAASSDCIQYSMALYCMRD